MEKENKQVIQIKPEVAAGKYSNLAIISHSPSEFIIDFAAALPGLAGPEVVSRILMNPGHAKRLLNALADNISKYEANFGAIQLGPEPKGTLNLADFMQNGGNGSNRS